MFGSPQQIHSEATEVAERHNGRRGHWVVPIRCGGHLSLASRLRGSGEASRGLVEPQRRDDYDDTAIASHR